MCLSLVGLYLSFVVSSLLGEYYGSLLPSVREGFCIGFSAIVHYFLLVYFLMTVAQSILLYLKLVKVMGNHNFLSKYSVKTAIVCWSKLNK